MVFCRAFA
jgi:drug/metabolite transporter (DMT)-like permease